MKRHLHLFHCITEWPNLEHALALAMRGKRDRAEVQAFLSRLPGSLEQIGERAAGGHGPLGHFREFRIRDPKPRTISAPCFADRVPRTLEGHRHSVNGVAITPDGRRAVSASLDKTLRVWDLESGQSIRTLEGHTNSVLAVAVTPDGCRAVSASSDQTLRLWDLGTGQSMRPLEGHSWGGERGRHYARRTPCGLGVP